MSAEDSQRRLAGAAFGIGACVAAALIYAASATGSSALQSQGVLALTAASSQGLLFHALSRARGAGGGRDLAFWSLTVPILLFGLGAGVTIRDGIDRLSGASALKAPGTAAAVLGLALVATAILTWMTARTVAGMQAQAAAGIGASFDGKRPRRNAVVAALAVELAAALGGVVAAGAGVAGLHLGELPEADGAASIAIGLIMGLVAALAAIEVRGLLRGLQAAESPAVGAGGISVAADPEQVDGHAAAVASVASTVAAPGPEAVTVAAVQAECPATEAEPEKPSQPAGKPQITPRQAQHKKGRGKRRR